MKKKKWQIGLLTVLLLCVVQSIRIAYLAGEFTSLKYHSNSQCRSITGVLSSEDITIHPRTGMAFISSDERRVHLRRKPGMRGDIWGYDLASKTPKLIPLTTSFKNPFRPHGISLWLDKNGKTSLFVINHAKGKHSVEIFDYTQNKLVHRKTVSDPRMHHPNDLVAVGPNAFYATNDHGNRTAWGRALEDLIPLHRAFVVYYDGQKMHKVAQGMGYANGINVYQDKLYVTTTIGRKLYIFQRNFKTGTLTFKKKIYIPSGLDNIELDAQGRLWIGAHPKLITFVRHASNTTRLSPSEIIRVSLDKDHTPTVKQIYLQDGTMLSGSSVGAVWKKHLLIGAVVAPHFLHCTRK